MEITREQAQGVLQSLYPNGDQCCLASHTRSYLQGLVGFVPAELPMFGGASDDHLKLADALEAIAAHLRKGIDQ